MEPEHFKQLLLQKSVEDIVEECILTDDPGQFTTMAALEEFKETLRVAFQLSIDTRPRAIVVGSAKLGFSYLEKRARDGTSYKPAYRSYEPGESDIDIAVISPHIYGRIWQDLARLGSNQTKFPWKNDMSPYMFHGWIRPDKFPHPAPQLCVDWKKAIDDTSRNPHFRYKKLRCGLYQSRYFLKLYQSRGVRQARQIEESK